MLHLQSLCVHPSPAPLARPAIESPLPRVACQLRHRSKTPPAFPPPECSASRFAQPEIIWFSKSETPRHRSKHLRKSPPPQDRLPVLVSFLLQKAAQPRRRFQQSATYPSLPRQRLDPEQSV